MNKSKKKLTNRLFATKTIWLLVMTFLLLVLWSAYREHLNRRAIDREIAQLESEIRALEERNKQLKDLIEFLKSDRFIEQEARSKLGLVKPGERLLIVENPASNEPGSAVATENISLFKNAKLWWRYFFGVGRKDNQGRQ